MTTIAKNIDARFKLTTQIISGEGIPGLVVSRPQVYLSAYDAADELFGSVYKKPGMPTIEDCKSIANDIFAKHGPVFSNAIFARFGIQHLRELPPMLMKDFWLYCASVLVYGANPEYGWTLDRISPEVRSRWLLWHPESDCLWEVHGSLAGELDSGEVSDVTGIPEHERRFAEQNVAEEL